MGLNKFNSGTYPLTFFCCGILIGKKEKAMKVMNSSRKNLEWRRLVDFISTD